MRESWEEQTWAARESCQGVWSSNNNNSLTVFLYKNPPIQKQSIAVPSAGYDDTTYRMLWRENTMQPAKFTHLELVPATSELALFSRNPTSQLKTQLAEIETNLG